MMERMQGIYAPDYKEAPYWWDAAPRPQLPETPLPERADVVIVGSGVTGLNAARELARGGRHVAVLDAEDAGYGASTRNMGFISSALKRSFADLLKSHGLERAKAYYLEARDAFESVARTIENEKIDCHYRQCGRVYLARSQRQLGDIVEEYELKRRHLGHDFEVLDRAALLGEFDGSEDFVAGVLIPGLASFHPGKYHAGLLKSAMESGAEIHPHTTAEAIGEPGPDGRLDIQTSRGRISARNVIVATNGYTGANLKWLRPRLLPFHAFALATEELSDNQLDSLMPNRRTYLDANFNTTAIQVAPGGRRILMSGLTGTEEKTMEAKTRKLRELFVSVFPQLGDIQLGRFWTGWCSAPIDRLPKLIHHKGVHYATGYSFVGMPMGTYLGHKAAWQVMGLDEGQTIFSDRDFPTNPLIANNTWFVPLAMHLYDLRDRWVNR
jgi:glycine/D-amino acid oxidase-like deaminating enzyme